MFLWHGTWESQVRFVVSINVNGSTRTGDRSQYGGVCTWLLSLVNMCSDKQQQWLGHRDMNINIDDVMRRLLERHHSFIVDYRYGRPIARNSPVMP